MKNGSGKHLKVMEKVMENHGISKVQKSTNSAYVNMEEGDVRGSSELNQG